MKPPRLYKLRRYLVIIIGLLLVLALTQVLVEQVAEALARWGGM